MLPQSCRFHGFMRSPSPFNRGEETQRVPSCMLQTGDLVVPNLAYLKYEVVGSRDAGADCNVWIRAKPALHRLLARADQAGSASGDILAG